MSDVRGQFTRGRIQLAAIVERIFQQIEAADQEDDVAERVIFGQRFHDLIRSTNERC